MIQKQLPLNEKVKIINEDVFNYKPTQKFNTIYMDIWNYINKDVYENEVNLYHELHKADNEYFVTRLLYKY